MIGFSIGKLRVVRRLPPTKHGHAQWLCQCDCGGEIIALAGNLRRGDYHSCGCARLEIRRKNATKHGMHMLPEYRIWKGMIARCKYRGRRYAELGIAVCGKWAKNFVAFYNDVGPRPTPLHTLDRFPNGSGDYEPGNVRWATLEEQTANKGCRIVINVNGEEMFLTKAARRLGIPYRTAYDQYRSGKLVGRRRDGKTATQRGVQNAVYSNCRGVYFHTKRGPG